MRKKRIEGALRDALERQKLRLVFQPKFTLAAEPRLAGAEALLRWRHPDLGEISPSEFIPIAEMSPLIVAVDRYVYTSTISLIAAWRARAFDVPTIAINLSPLSLREPDFAGLFVQALDASDIPHALLQVEITEGALLENETAVFDNLDRLHREGIDIAIDDFGTGFSSFAYLKRLLASELKIDRGFVQGLGQTHEDEAIVQTMLTLGRSLDLRTVAEGVETRQQLEWLRAAGCQIGQGFLLSLPLERHDFEALIAKDRWGNVMIAPPPNCLR